MKLESKSFPKEVRFLVSILAMGRIVHPSLIWSEFPGDSKSFALPVIDPDAPGGDFIHWLITNIPAETRGIFWMRSRGIQLTLLN